MDIYKSIKEVVKNSAIIGGLALILNGCQESSPRPSKDAKSINRILRSTEKPEKTAVVYSDPKILYSEIEKTDLYVEIDGVKKRLLEAKNELITDIEVGDLNADGIDDFIVSYRKFDYGYVVGTRGEKYLSQNKTFEYKKTE